jgi:LPXTG-motif cell wall-anchored protein
MQQTVDLIIKVVDPSSALPTTGDSALLVAGIALLVALAATGIFALRNKLGGGGFPKPFLSL